VKGIKNPEFCQNRPVFVNSTDFLACWPNRRQRGKVFSPNGACVASQALVRLNGRKFDVAGLGCLRKWKSEIRCAWHQGAYSFIRGQRPSAEGRRDARFGRSVDESQGNIVKALVKSIARRFGYELRKIAPPPSAVLINFINAPEAVFEPDLGDAVPSKICREFSASPDSTRTTHSLIVEGWRFLPHSYAMVNQWQLLSLSRRTDVALKVSDAPLYVPRWERQEGIFEPCSEQILKSIACAAPDENADLTLRISFPFDFAPSRSRQTAVFGTSEYQAIRKEQCRDYRTYQQFQQRLGPLSEVKAVTPSRWSAEGFYKSGFRTDQVVVVPHGVDIETFHPMPDLRSHIRRKLSIAESDFVFLSVGAMTPHKGIDLLLRVFAEVSQKFPHARLVLKGLNPLYQSKERLLKIMQKLPPRDQESVIGKIKYVGRSFSNREMALLYQAADAYVSPYRSEGFNMPVLEAAACGIPIICTSGGATDDFVTETFARKIESARRSNTQEDQEFVWREPKLEHLIALMTSAIEDSAWRSLAAKAGPLHVGASYTWDRVVDTLLQELLH
jgi:glycosyltransferase involved in cell wall biosynthesis